MVTIDRIGPDRAIHFARLQAITFKQAYSGVHSRVNIEAYCTANYTAAKAKVDLSARDTVCCIGCVNSEPSGYYVLKHHACPVPLSSESSEIKQIYVLSSAYGSGLGRALYEHAVEVVLATGRNWVWLCVSDINYRAQAFYSKLAFKKVGVGPVQGVGTERLPSSILALGL